MALSLFGTSSLQVQETFAMRKRLLVPRWWLEGAFCQAAKAGTRGLLDCYFGNRLTASPGSDVRVHVHESSALNPKIFGVMVSFWNAVIRHLLREHAAGRAEDLCEVSVPCAELFRGTESECAASTADFFRAMMSPIETYLVSMRGRLRGARGAQSLTLRHDGQTTALVSHVKRSVDGRSLEVRFLRPLMDVVLPGEDRRAAEHLSSAQQPAAVLTLAPSVLRWHGDKCSVRRLAAYLLVELMKGEGRSGVLAGGGDSGLKALVAAVTAVQAKDLLAEWVGRASGLYDHGILGWHQGFPLGRVGELSRLHSPGQHSGCVQILALADHLDEVVAFERAVDKTLVRHSVLATPTHRPRAELSPPALPSAHTSGSSVPLSEGMTKVGVAGGAGVGATKVRTSRRLASLVRRSEIKGKATVTPCSPRPPQPPYGDPVPRGRESSTATVSGTLGQTPLLGNHRPAASRPASSRRDPAESDMEYVLKLAQYYESLTPGQRRELDREMKDRSPAEFRAWLGPILDRTH